MIVRIQNKINPKIMRSSKDNLCFFNIENFTNKYNKTAIDKYCNLNRQIILLNSNGNNHSNLPLPMDWGYKKYCIKKSLKFILPKKIKVKNTIKVVIIPATA